jgi:hypothetical protein
VHVVDTKSDEIDAEFREAMAKIEVKKSFSCPQWAKICKSKGGLTKHTNLKHLDLVVHSSTTKSSEEETRLSEENLASNVEDIKRV